GGHVRFYDHAPLTSVPEPRDPSETMLMRACLQGAGTAGLPRQPCYTVYMTYRSVGRAKAGPARRVVLLGLALLAAVSGATGAVLAATGDGSRTLVVRITATSHEVVTVSFRAPWTGTEACSRYDTWTATAHPHLAITAGTFGGTFSTTTEQHITIAGRI